MVRRTGSSKSSHRWRFIAAVAATLSFGCTAAAPQVHAPRPSVESGSQAESRDELSSVEWSRLRDGQSIERRVTFSHAGRQLFGGVAYVMVEAPPELVWSQLAHSEQLGQLLPRTKRVEPEVGYEPEVLRLTQGNSWIEASYSLAFDWEPETSNTDERSMRFWLDPTQPHDINDLWGYFRVAPIDQNQSLVTMAVAVDLGHELIEMLFRSRIERLIFETPRRLRQAVADREPNQLAQR